MVYSIPMFSYFLIKSKIQTNNYELTKTFKHSIISLCIFGMLYPAFVTYINYTPKEKLAVKLDRQFELQPEIPGQEEDGRPKKKLKRIKLT